MKSEIARINAQDITKDEVDAIQKAARKYLKDNPEGAHEPRGKRGRPKSATGAASSSQAPKKEPDSAASSSQTPKKESWDATLWDSKTSKSYWNSKSMPYVVNQLRLRGFENRREWNEIKQLNKSGLLKFVMELIVDDKW